MIRLTRPFLGDSSNLVAKVIEEGFLVQGRYVEDFESKISNYVGRRFGIAVNSGTSAIQCAVQALGLKQEDEVIVPDFTFPATANAVITAGATPILVDIDIRTFNISPQAVEDAVNSRTKAVIPVDLFGLPADLEQISEICRRKGLFMIEDSACALGSKLGKKKCGSFGEISVLSFHPRKILTTGEGGMVLTDSEEHCDFVRSLRNHGIRSHEQREFVMPGYNMRMNEIQACMGIVQFEHIDFLIAERKRIADLYNHLLSDIEELRVPQVPEGYFHTYQSYVVLLSDSIDRDVLIELMRERGIETTFGTYAIHCQPYYRNRFGFRPGQLNSSYRAWKQSLSLPIYTSMKDEEVIEVVESLKRCIVLSRR